MAKSLYDIAVESNALSEVSNGREKITNEDIKKYYPNGITIDEVDFIEMMSKRNNELQNVAIIHFKEEEKKFFYGGTVVTASLMRILHKGFDGSLTDFNDALKKEGLKAKLTNVRGTENDYTAIEFIK